MTRVLEAEGERIHPASNHLASESAHIESESAEHDLHCFQALREMDEILVANFMVFHEVAAETDYDLWIADEGWEHRPLPARAPGAEASQLRLADRLRRLSADAGRRRRVRPLTADYNAEMVEHVADHPQVRDRAIFVGNPDDCVDALLGPGLPSIREWTEEHFDFAGYVTGFDPADLGDRGQLREQLGYHPDERVCLVTVGGTGVGESLLRKVIDSYPEAKSAVPDLRMVVVTGPRIDPASLPSHAGLEVRPYVHQLYRHLAACDLAVVQGGLTTSMELTANKRPFLYFPLEHHFEQNFHVAHRLERYGAGQSDGLRRRQRRSRSPPRSAEEIGRDVDYRDVETDGARNAAKLLAEML